MGTLAAIRRRWQKLRHLPIVLTLFPIIERFGYHLTRSHYYEPVPDTRSLPDRLWLEESDMVGIDMREQEQIDLLRGFVRDFGTELALLPADPDGTAGGYYFRNPWFGKVDAEILYGMVRSAKPRRVIEIGGGLSTTLFAQAIRRNQRDDPDYVCRFTTIEPFPSEVLRDGFPGRGELVVAPVQQVPLAQFGELGANDILFIDSSHMLKIGSDVQYEYLEVLPRLARGVLVHVHDVFLPAEYPKHLVLGWYRFWNEQYLLQAFLSGNRDFVVRWGSSFMHLRHRDDLEAAFGPYRQYDVGIRLPPSSFWMQRVL